ncbi:MAG: hypothetical protein RMI53_06325, partial [Nitrososphaerota archaeon]|nr:hypothetical protein [Nitrososphaerota archaeon]
MVESVGNYTKHRRVPVMIKEGSSYLTFFVPAISGESIAHCYQTILSEELLKLNEEVCEFCRKGIFIKSTNKEVYKEAFKKDIPKTSKKRGKKEIEEDVTEINEMEIAKNSRSDKKGGNSIEEEMSAIDEIER